MTTASDTTFDALWDYNDPAASEARFLTVRQTLGAAEDHARLMELDTQIARAQGLQGRFADALAMLEMIEGALRPDETRAAVRHQLEFGRVLRSSGSPEAARPFFERAQALAEASAEDRFAVDARHMVALVEPDPGRRISLMLDDLEFAAASSDPVAREWRGTLWNNIGMAFHEMGDLDDALDAFETAAGLWEEDDPKRVLVAHWMVAWTLRLQGRHAEALAAQEVLERAHQTAGTPGGYVQEELGELHLALASGPGAEDHRRLARGHFARAHELLLKELAGDPDRLARMKRIADGEEDD
ncbi:MAG TPA: tetratricopeptide repeat protein [Caulobacteraceae bacterium]|jgi:tetratricopeptide (TPR) repeat protein